MPATVKHNTNHKNKKLQNHVAFFYIYKENKPIFAGTDCKSALSDQEIANSDYDLVGLTTILKICEENPIARICNPCPQQ
ncbi:hypothetical protein APR43_19220 [Flavobacterium sp. NLM]|nr:hypothetical protein APR43_19220 [Flavobacterium sp. NLM]